MPVIGMPSGKPATPRVTATFAALGTISGSTRRGTFSSAHISSDQVRLPRSMSKVREALVTSVICGALAPGPPASRQTRYESTVPNAS